MEVSISGQDFENAWIAAEKLLEYPQNHTRSLRYLVKCQLMRKGAKLGRIGDAFYCPHCDHPQRPSPRNELYRWGDAMACTLCHDHFYVEKPDDMP